MAYARDGAQNHKPAHRYFPLSTPARSGTLGFHFWTAGRTDMDAVRDAAFVLLVLPLGGFLISGAVVLAFMVVSSPVLGLMRLRRMLVQEDAEEPREGVKQHRRRPNGKKPGAAKAPIRNSANS
jgi:hypothetical protein